jgi:hypothetical protein
MPAEPERDIRPCKTTPRALGTIRLYAWVLAQGDVPVSEYILKKLMVSAVLGNLSPHSALWAATWLPWQWESSTTSLGSVEGGIYCL